MPNNVEQTPIQIAWINFAKSVQILLVPQIDDRPLDQYLAFRDAVLAMVQSEKFLTELDGAWKPLNGNLQIEPEIGNALLLELQTFPLALEVAKATEKAEDPKGWWKKMLGRGSTVSGSVKDLVQNLPPYAKGAITLFSELINLFKGSD